MRGPWPVWTLGFAHQCGRAQLWVIGVLLFAVVASQWVRHGTRANAGMTGLEAHTLEVNGVTRHYELYLPPGTGEDGRALVLVFHGGEGNPRKIARQTDFNRVAAEQGFAVAYPASIEHWNDGRSTTRDFGDDVAFSRMLIEHLVKTESVDSRRVYATGASNGGMFTLRLACEAGDQIAAFAPALASFPVPYAEQCRPSGPVAIMMINGTADRLIRWRGGRIPKGRRAGVGGQVIPVPDTVAFWREHNDCGAAAVEKLPDTSDDGTHVEVEQYNGCSVGGGVTLVRVEGGGHTWPGSPAQPLRRLAGPVSHDVDASEMIWEFFSGLRLRTAGDGSATREE